MGDGLRYRPVAIESLCAALETLRQLGRGRMRMSANEEDYNLNDFQIKEKNLIIQYRRSHTLSRSEIAALESLRQRDRGRKRVRNES